MRGFAPFEPAPRIAVAVSGGADSMALAHLADGWARSLGGHIVAVTVDHGMRPESAAEARRVAGWMAARGVTHETLVWAGPHPAQNRQAAARRARYRLIDEWCQSNGALHVLLGHHQDDQAETLLLRLARGTGMTGLSGMAAVSELAHCRLLRPLLEVPPAALRATLRALGQDWVEDPSNRDQAFDRARLRARWPTLRQSNLVPERLAAAAMHVGRARGAIDRVVAEVLSSSAGLHPAGLVTLKPAILQEFDDEIRLRALAAIVRTVGGNDYAPRFMALERLDRACIDGTLKGGRTLAGCRIAPDGENWLIYREPARVAARTEIPANGRTIWDRRFVVEADPGGALRIGAFGGATTAERRAIVECVPTPHFLRKQVWPSLPGVWQEDRLIHVPHLGWRLPGVRVSVAIRFRPEYPLCDAGFGYRRSERPDS